MDVFLPSDLSGPAAWCVAGLVGLLLGSFASALTYRIPRGLSWVAVRSACPHCGHVLTVADLIPVLSWVFLRGRCRHCRAAIGWRYPAIELATLCGCVAVAVVYGFSPPGIVVMAAVPFLVAMMAIDLDHMILPDQGNIILAVLGIIFVVLSAPGSVVPALGLAVLAAAVYAGLVFLLGRAMAVVLKKETVGMGDVKFFAVTGLWIGLAALPAFLIVAGLMGAVMGVFWKVALRSDRFPFGPALIMALWVCLLAAGAGFAPIPGL